MSTPTRNKGTNVFPTLNEMSLELDCTDLSKPSSSSFTADSGVKSGKLSDHYHNEASGPATGWEARLLSRLKALQNTSSPHDYLLKYNGEALNYLHNVKFLKTNDPPLLLEEVRRILFGRDYTNVPNPKEFPGTDFRQLVDLSETAFQSSVHFQETFIDNIYAQAVDLHSSGKKLYPLASTTNDIGESVIFSSGKPDVASLVVPLILELKSDHKEGPILSAADFEVLLQGIDRLVALIDVKGYLCRCFAIVVSSRSAHVIQLRRREELLPEPSATGKYLSIDIVRIAIRDVAPVWCLLTNVGLAHPESFVSRDGPALEATLKAFGTQMQHCRVSLVSYSALTSVYFITRCDSVGVFSLNRPDYSVKINRNMERFDLEAKAHCRIAPHYIANNDTYSSYYVLGLYENGIDKYKNIFQPLAPCGVTPDLPDRSTLVKASERRTAAWRALESTDDTAAHRLFTAEERPSWLQECPRPAGSADPFGAVLMLPGKSHGPIVKRETDLRRAFLYLDRARVWHTDYRSMNVLYFQQLDSWHIIDMDHAICAEREPQPTTLVWNSPRANMCVSFCVELVGRSFDNGAKITVQWDDRTETSMFEGLLDRLRRRG